MQDAGPGRLLVVESCRWLCLVTRFVHVVACVAVVAVVCVLRQANINGCTPLGSAETLKQG